MLNEKVISGAESETLVTEYEIEPGDGTRYLFLYVGGAKPLFGISKNGQPVGFRMIFGEFIKEPSGDYIANKLEISAYDAKVLIWFYKTYIVGDAEGYGEAERESFDKFLDRANVA